MMTNFACWADRRKTEIGIGPVAADAGSGPPTAAAEEEGKKLDERVGKFRDKLSFQKALKELPRRKQRRSSASSHHKES
eukprot:gene37060-48388_t